MQSCFPNNKSRRVQEKDVHMKEKIDIDGKIYVPQVFLVNTRDRGSLMNATRIPNDHSVSLGGGEEFVILYVPVVETEKVEAHD